MKITHSPLIFHLDHNAPHLLLNILDSHCFQFFLGITVVPREVEDNGYAKFGVRGGGERYIILYMRMVN